MVPCHSGAAPAQKKWSGKEIELMGQKVYLTILMSFLLRNEYGPEESGVDMSTPVHPMAPPLLSLVVYLARFVLSTVSTSESICANYCLPSKKKILMVRNLKNNLHAGTVPCRNLCCPLHKMLSGEESST